MKQLQNNNNNGEESNHEKHKHEPHSSLHTKVAEIEELSSKSYNIFRDSPLRYLGYANEIGESFRYQLPRMVLPTYILAFGYCTADAISTGYIAYNNATNSDTNTSDNSNGNDVSSATTIVDTTTNDISNSINNNNISSASTIASSSSTVKSTVSTDVLKATFDTLLWQCLASVLIPGFTINIIVKAARFAVGSRTAGAAAISVKTGSKSSSSTTATATSALFTQWFPTATGLFSIPFIIKPIDDSVDYLLDNTTRKWF